MNRTFPRRQNRLQIRAMSRPRLIALLLAFATLVIFLPVGSHPFVNYDDTDYITENPFVKNGLTLTDIRWAFTTFHAGNWHPLTWISHMLDCQLFGPNAGAQHFVSVLWHATNAALLFTLLLRLTKKIWPSAFVAALFAWHPLHVESVAWIAERKDVLSTFFALLTLLSYSKYVEESKAQSPKAKFFFAYSLLAFALGLMAKPMLVTLPFVLLLLDFWPLQRFPLSAFRFPLLFEKFPFLLLSAISCVITFLAQKSGEAVVSLDHVPLLYRLENAPVAVVNYLQKFFWPAGLCVIYPQPEKIPPLSVIFSLALLVMISLAIWRSRNSRPYWLVGWLWFLGTLVPVIGLVQVGGQAFADRYTYIPSIGFFITVVFGLNDWSVRMQTPKIIAAGFAAVILTGCILATENQLTFWRDSETLFRRAIAVTRDNDIALVNLGVALDVQNRFDESLEVYRAATQLKSGRYQLHNNLGNILDKLGRHAESLVEYRAAIRLRPGDAYLHNAAGSELGALGQFDDALKEFAEAERLAPGYAQPHAETAKLLFQQGRDAEAINELHRALENEPDNYQILATAAHYLAANENAAARDGRRALALAIKANDLSGHLQPMVFDVLGMALAETGDFVNAQACAQNACDLAAAAQMKKLEPALRQRLELYQNRQPWFESFCATNAPVKK
jgi:tetratricopeptide (TPR) repeat protein